jgi:hypothetical protein
MLMLIYGLAAHMLPRFTGNPILTGVWPWLQMALVHVGLLAYSVGFLLGIYAVIIAGGGLIWLSLLVFTVRILPVLWPASHKNGMVIPLHIQPGE